jgi:hypothetical protein
VLLLLIVASVQPASAASVVTSYGTAGRWIVKDTATQPSLRCVYINPDATDGQISRIKVWPPKAFGKSSAARLVGWRFEVRGRVDDPGASPEWISLFSSPIYKDYATSSRAANSFAPKSYLPDDDIRGGDADWVFDIYLTIFWFTKQRQRSDCLFPAVTARDTSFSELNRRRLYQVTFLARFDFLSCRGLFVSITGRFGTPNACRSEHLGRIRNAGHLAADTPRDLRDTQTHAHSDLRNSGTGYGVPGCEPGYWISLSVR